MGQLTEKAVGNHKSFYSCSAAVLCAFAGQAGLTEQSAKKEAAPFAGGKMEKCGAVMSAEYVLKQKCGEESDEKIKAFEEQFVDAGKGSVMCRDLRGKGSKSCRACVTDAAKILEDMI